MIVTSTFCNGPPQPYTFHLIPPLGVCIYSETCLIQHARGEKFCVGIDRVSYFTYKRAWKSTLDNTGKMDYTGVGLVRSYCSLSSGSKIFHSNGGVTDDGLKSSAFGQRLRPLRRRDLYRVTPAVTRGLGFCSLIQRTASISSPPMTSKGVPGTSLRN